MKRLALIALFLPVAAGCTPKQEPTALDRFVASNPELLEGRREVGGQVQLSCEQGDAELYVDGVLQGRCADFAEGGAPLKVSEGAHVVEVRKPGFVPYRAEVLTGDARTSLNIHLLPMN